MNITKETKIDTLKDFFKKNKILNVGLFYDCIEHNRLDCLEYIVNNVLTNKNDIKKMPIGNNLNFYLASAYYNRLNFIIYLEDNFGWYDDISEAFKIACCKNGVDVVKHFVKKHKFDVNTIYLKNRTGAAFAIGNGHLDVIKFLDENGLDVHGFKFNGWNIFEYCISNKKPEIAEYLDNKYNFELTTDRFSTLIWSTEPMMVGEVEDLEVTAKIKNFLRRKRYKRKFATVENKSSKCCICNKDYKDGDECCRCMDGHVVHQNCYVEHILSTDLVYDNPCITCKKKMLKGGFKY